MSWRGLHRFKRTEPDLGRGSRYLYTRLTGVNFRWADTEEYVSTGHGGNGLFYDRLYDRAVDNTKILKATGFKNEDFTSIEDGIKIELNNIGF